MSKFRGESKVCKNQSCLAVFTYEQISARRKSPLFKKGWDEIVYCSPRCSYTGIRATMEGRRMSKEKVAENRRSILGEVVRFEGGVPVYRVGRGVSGGEFDTPPGEQGAPQEALDE